MSLKCFKLVYIKSAMRVHFDLLEAINENQDIIISLYQTLK